MTGLNGEGLRETRLNCTIRSGLEITVYIKRTRIIRLFKNITDEKYCSLIKVTISVMFVTIYYKLEGILRHTSCSTELYFHTKGLVQIAA